MGRCMQHLGFAHYFIFASMKYFFSNKVLSVFLFIIICVGLRSPGRLSGSTRIGQSFLQSLDEIVQFNHQVVDRVFVIKPACLQ